MEEEKPKRGRPRKEAVSETAIVPVDDEEPWVPVPKRTRKKKEPVQESAPEPETVQEPAPPKPKRAKKKPDPATAVASDVSFQSKRGVVNFSAMRAPPKPKVETVNPFFSFEATLGPEGPAHLIYIPTSSVYNWPAVEQVEVNEVGRLHVHQCSV